MPDVHLAAVDVGLLARERVVELEVVGEVLDDRLPLVIVQEGVAVGDAKEEPRKALVVLIRVRVRVRVRVHLRAWEALLSCS